jgi:hypothetical protein
VSNDTVAKYLLKLQEMTQHSDTPIDMYKIGEDIGLLDKVQTDHIVEILSKTDIFVIMKILKWD